MTAAHRLAAQRLAALDPARLPPAERATRAAVGVAPHLVPGPETAPAMGDLVVAAREHERLEASTRR